MHPNRIEYQVGSWFEGTSLTYVGEAEPRSGDKYKRRRIVCKCSCGNVKDYDVASIKHGHARSCGCRRRETSRRKNLKLVHGVPSKQHPHYSIWMNIKQRCYNPNKPDYLRYGARGIIMCPAWKDEFSAFACWTVDNIGWRPSLKHQLDRWPNNDGNYEPGNVRWATPRQNVRNRSNSTPFPGLSIQKTKTGFVVMRNLMTTVSTIQEAEELAIRWTAEFSEQWEHERGFLDEIHRV